jgi:tetratricopeptide (TPR) repeat protein
MWGLFGSKRARAKAEAGRLSDEEITILSGDEGAVNSASAMWTARPVFISSTFLDMQAERDYLRTRVFPALEERLRARRHNLEWVDLRVGVATAGVRDANTRELHILKVCLAEVKRCRPFLIVLLGDRYGWAPPEDRVRAAAAEEGFAADIAGRSLTDLEIDFGILSNPEQQSRSIFYFRDPLPYRDMPPQLAALFSNDYEPDSGAADRVRRLATLKQRIETQLPTRVRHYAAQWDTEGQCVSGLELWGQMVLEDIWSELEVETRDAAASVDISWQQAERNALDDFAEDRARDFVGRQAIIACLTSLCLSPARDGTPWGICVTGDPGSGKSALFGALYRPPKPETAKVVSANQRHSSGSTCRLGGSDVFLLAHASGASVAAASVDSMLRRWIDELATALGIRDVGLAENVDAETVEATFVRLLGQKASQQRVVVLVDALDQFETTTRGRYVTWLPRLWPANARLIATAIAGDASKVLGERPGMEALSLPPLDAAEARGIVKGICDRYHREFEPEVVDPLLAKTGTAGPAWGNPLWLVIAVEELNLLDADDFDRARTYEGRPDEQLRTLMLEFITKFPGDISGLYGHTFDRAEKLFGAGVTRGFLGLIAVSRAGWREGDFRILLPRVTGEPWDELQFAQLRRLFRGQMRRRGALSRWDFNHAQMRAAVRARRAALSIPEQKLHAMIADRLLSCPPDDPLHLSETMVHLLASEDYVRAAGYYGDTSLSEAEVQGATRVLADAVVAPGAGRATDVAQQFCRLLDAPGLDESVGVQVGRRFTFELNDAIEHQAALDARLILAEGVNAAFERLFRLKPNDRNRQRDLSASYEKIGDVLAAQGHLPEALKSFRDGFAIRDRLAKADPGNAGWLRGLSVSYEKVGEVLVAQGHLREALHSFRDGRLIRDRLAKADPGNAGWQRDLSVSYQKVGDVLAAQGNLLEALKSYRASHDIFDRLAKADPGNAGWQRDLSVSYNKAGEVLVAQGHLPEALKSFREGLAIADRLAKADPGNAGWQRDLGVSNERIGDVQIALGDLAAAVKSYEANREIISRLAKADPGNAGWQRDLSVSYDRFGDVLVAQGDLPEALKSFRDGLAIADRLTRADPANAGWQRDLSVSYNKVGDVLKAQGNLPEALKSFREALAITDRLAKADPGNASWQRDLGISNARIGDVQIALGDLAAAVKSYEANREIISRLAKADPGNADWQRDLSMSYTQAGDVLVVQGHLPEALKSYRDALAIADRLARADPANAGWQRDLSLSYAKLAFGYRKSAQPAKAGEALTAGRAIISRLVAQFPYRSQWKQDLSWFDQQIAALKN